MKNLIRKGLALLITSMLLVSFFLAAGCAASKKSYEERMVSILDEAKKELDDNHKELAKVEMEKSAKAKDQKKKTLVEKQIEILEKTRDKIQDVAAPDDVFAGHSDVIEFLQLLIKTREAALKNIGKKEGAKTSTASSDAFKNFQFSGRAFARASSELPFLEYELRNTFETVLQDVQMDIEPQSGFGRPPSSGSPVSPGKTVP